MVVVGGLNFGQLKSSGEGEGVGGLNFGQLKSSKVGVGVEGVWV